MDLGELEFSSSGPHRTFRVCVARLGVAADFCAEMQFMGSVLSRSSTYANSNGQFRCVAKPFQTNF